VGKELLVDAVHLAEVGHVVEEDVDLFRSTISNYASGAVARSEEGCVNGDEKGYTFTTRVMSVPASVKMAMMFSQHALVLSAMLPSTSLPSLSAGI
jgi:hypothetical protein